MSERFSSMKAATVNRANRTLPQPAGTNAPRLARGPRDHRHVRYIVALSICLHVLTLVLVTEVAWWLDRHFLAQASSPAQSGPAPEQPMTMQLVADDPQPPESAPPPPPAPPVTIPLPEVPLSTNLLPQPSPQIPHPPVPSPQFVQQVATTLVTTTAVKIVTKPSAKPRPQIVAQNAIAEGKTPVITPPRVGMPGLPAPSYPPEALAHRQGGTVGMQVAFGPDGRVTHAEVCHSSGYSILDSSTLNFVYANWKSADLANTTVQVPIIYNPREPRG